MNFLTAFHTDIGIKKKTNQDSLLIHQARTDTGNVLLAVICDGMGGLAKGEVASACMIRAFSSAQRGPPTGGFALELGKAGCRRGSEDRQLFHRK